jgi:short-subunit dehydrogenase
MDLDGTRVIVTGASTGIGRVTALRLARRGARVFAAARDERRLDALAAEHPEIVAAPCDVADDADRAALVKQCEPVDVLVNNAGVGIGAAVDGHVTKHLDLQLDVNVRAIVLFYRECAELLRAAGAEHRRALVVNMASMAGKSPQPWLSVYSATKAAVVAYTTAMNKELNGEGVKSVAFCPGFVDTDMSEFVKESIPAEEMLRTSDIAEALRFLLRLSPNCVIPEIIFQRPGEAI